MGKRVLNFEGYLRRVNEGLINTNEGVGSAIARAGRAAVSGIEKMGKSIAASAARFKEMIKRGMIKIIPSGPQAGTPTVNYFAATDGNIVDQVDDLYRGTEFAKMNPVPGLSESQNFPELEEAKVPLDWRSESGEEIVRSVGPDELVEEIMLMYKARQLQIKDALPNEEVRFGGAAKPLFIFGAPGIGKTQLMAQAAQKLGIDLIKMDVQNMTVEDFRGVPKAIDLENPEVNPETGRVTSVGKGVTRFNFPASLPIDKGSTNKCGIIFMDEMNRTQDKRLFAAMMQFIQLGRLDDPEMGGYLLPHGWCLAAAGNRPQDTRGVGKVIEFDDAQADRFKMVNYVPELPKFAKFARSKGYQPEIIKFIEQNEELFHYLDDEKEEMKFPNPRAWEDGMMALQQEVELKGLTDWKEMPTSRIRDIFRDAIGSEGAIRLQEYLDILKSFSERDLEQMVTDPENAKKLTGREKNYTNVAFGLGEMLIKKANELGGGKASNENLANIIKYYLLLTDNPGYEEIATSLYVLIKEKFPQFSIESILQEKDRLENDLKAGKITQEEFNAEIEKMRPMIEGAKLLAKSMKDRGIY